MGQEIERKYLVTNDAFKKHANSSLIRQGYLTADAHKPVRVRVIDKNAWLNIKAKMQGLKRYEFEYEIPVTDANQMLDALCYQPVIEKVRYVVEYGGITWEIDEFLGANKGLVIAEVELHDENQDIDLPSWIGREVTGDRRYYNAYIAQNPYKNWSNGG